MAGQSRTLKLSILGDIDQLKKSLNTGSNEVESFGSKLGDFSKKAGLAFAAAGVAAAAYAGKLLIDGVKSAIADEAAQTKLATTLGNVTGATNAQIKAVEDQILQTSLLTGKTDDELRPSLDRLLRSTKDITKAQQLQALALDISAGSGKSLEAVSNALAKSAEGQNTALGKLGVGISAAELKTMSFEQITAKLAGTFEGQASKQADTFQGKMARLTVAFDEAKETVGSYVLDALTPLISGFVDKGIPAIQDFAGNLSKTLGPAFEQIFKVVKEDVLPIIRAWWGFLSEVVIPAFGAIVRPAFEGLVSAFNKIKNAVIDNSDELKPLLALFKSIGEFVRDTLAPILGGAFKLALQAIGTIVGGLVTGFSRLVGFITNTVTKMKEFVNFVKDNPVTRFFFGDSGDKSLKAGGGFDSAGFGTSGIGTSGVGTSGVGTTLGQGVLSANQVIANKDGVNYVFTRPDLFYDPNGDPRTFTGAPLEAFSLGMQAAILRKNELAAETERLRKERADAAAARLAATGGLSTADRITINVNGALDAEGTARTIVDTLNNSYYRGTGGATNLQTA